MSHNYDQLIAPRLLDSRLKLHLTLQFLIHPQLVSNAATLSERLRESPWAIAEALEELAACQILSATTQLGARFYRLGSDLVHRARLDRLIEAFNDPHQRDQIHALVQAADREREYFALLAEERVAGQSMALVA